MIGNLSRRRCRAAISLLTLSLAAGACGGGDDTSTAAPGEGSGAATVDAARLGGEGDDGSNWLAHGRDQGEQRFSPLVEVNDANVRGLAVAWKFPTGLTRGHEATPIVVDGVMYVTGSWSVVFALDAVSGELLWKWDPKVSQEMGRRVCCDVVNRGVAVYEGKVFVGVLDGRLAALDASSGEVIWETVTVDQSKHYSITGAPRIAKGRVLIGNGGAEFGVRGYVSAYDPNSGEMLWRTYTVPGNPADPYESEALEAAAKTWTGDRYWEIGAGGTAWDSMAYDPALDLVYVGTGNGSPWSKYERSPGGGDNLYLSSILALRPDTGELVWHFQTTPSDNWDFTATQHMILADLGIGGVVRKVIMQAPKNGFFYVLDRETGEFISADNYVEVTWADGIDAETGRAIPSDRGEYETGLALVKPMAFGGHNWNPMSFNPITGLVYVPAQDIMGIYAREADYDPNDVGFNTGTNKGVFAFLNRDLVDGFLLAWDPVLQREAWRHPHGIAGNGGTLTTAGNLVFQGTADGRFLALKADDGTLLWQSHAADSGIIAAPMTFAVDGVQYVTVLAGWGGAYALAGGDAAAAASTRSEGMVITWALSNLVLTPQMVGEMIAGRDPEDAAGADLYHTWCGVCHGANAISAGATPDVGIALSRLGPAAFDAVVANGIPDRGMPAFGEELVPAQIAQIRRFIEQQSP